MSSPNGTSRIVAPATSMENQLELTQVTAQIRERSGPLPSPEDIAHYNQYIPDGADRIMRMAEKQSEHRIRIESLVIENQQKQSGRGQVFALVIGLFGLIVAGLVSITGHDWPGTVIGGTTVVSLVAAFIAGRYSQGKDLARKSGSGATPAS